MANVGAELAINTARGAVLGGFSTAIGGGTFEDGMRSGAGGAFVRTSINIGILAAAIRPTGDIKIALDKMGKDLKINLTGNYSPTYRTGALWGRGLTVGRTAEIHDKWGEGLVMSELGFMSHFITFNSYAQDGLTNLQTVFMNNGIWPIYLG